VRTLDRLRSLGCTLEWVDQIIIAVFGKIRQAEPSILFVIRVDQSFPIPSSSIRQASTAQSTSLDGGPPCLHASSCLQTSDAIGGHGICRRLPVQHLMTIWVALGEIEKVDSGEDDEEAA
jgi:hypothetical protein